MEPHRGLPLEKKIKTLPSEFDTASAQAKYKECIALHIGNIFQSYTEAQHTHMVERE